MAGRMAGTMNNIEIDIGDRHLIAMLQPLVGLKGERFRKAILRRRLRHAVNPKLVVFMRAYNRDIALIGHRLYRTGMVEMAMCDENFFNLNALLIDKFIEQCQIATGVDNAALFGFFVPKHGAVLLKRGHRNDLIAQHEALLFARDSKSFLQLNQITLQF